VKAFEDFKRGRFLASDPAFGKRTDFSQAAGGAPIHQRPLARMNRTKKERSHQSFG
jgi:hypothetical protein